MIANTRTEEFDRRGELLYRAKTIEFVDRIPQMPKNWCESGIMGYRKRMSNWENKMEHMERMAGQSKGIESNEKALAV